MLEKEILLLFLKIIEKDILDVEEKMEKVEYINVSGKLCLTLPEVV